MLRFFSSCWWAGLVSRDEKYCIWYKVRIHFVSEEVFNVLEAFAVLGSLIWIPGLGISAWIAGAVGSLIGCFIGIPIRRGLLAFRARRIANRTQVSPGGPS